jgi:hypothetical protein
MHKQFWQKITASSLAAIFSVLWLLLAGSLFAQEPSDVGPIDHDADPQVLRSFVVVPSPKVDPAWVNSLLINLGRLAHVKEVYLWPKQEQLDTPDGIASVQKWAALHGYAYILFVDTDLQNDQAERGVVVHYHTRDVLSGLESPMESFQAPLPDVQALQETFWLPLLAELDKLEAPAREGSLIVYAQKGTVVTGLSAKPLIIGTEGEAQVPLVIPGTYRWKAQAPGLASKQGVLFVRENPAVLRIKQEQSPGWALEWGALMGQFGDVWIQRLFNTDQIWLGFGLQQYWIGINFPSSEDLFPYTEPVISLPLLQPGLTAGFRFFDDTYYVRPYLSITLMARLNTALLMLDPVAPMVLSGNGGLEYRLAEKIAPFIELGASFYPFCNGLYMAASRGGATRAPSTFFYSNSWYIDIPLFRLGVRFFL